MTLQLPFPNDFTSAQQPTYKQKKFSFVTGVAQFLVDDEKNALKSCAFGERISQSFVVQNRRTG